MSAGHAWISWHREQFASFPAWPKTPPKWACKSVEFTGLFEEPCHMPENYSFRACIFTILSIYINASKAAFLTDSFLVQPKESRFFIPATGFAQRRAQRRSRLAAGHRRRRREAVLTAASTARDFRHWEERHFYHVRSIALTRPPYAVIGCKLNPGLFERLLHGDPHGVARHPALVLEIAHRFQSHPRLRRERLLLPIEQRARGAALGGRYLHARALTGIDNPVIKRGFKLPLLGILGYKCLRHWRPETSCCQ